LRTNESFAFDSLIATKYAPLHKSKATSFRGIKGESPLLNLRQFQMPRFIPVDALHVFDHGIIKLFLSAWLGNRTTRLLDSRYHVLTTLPWVMSKQKVDAIERDISNLHLPEQISRRVRSLRDYKHWKGDEFRVFALYISLPLLKNRLHDALWLHWKLFVEGYKILLKPEIYAGEIDVAEEKLLKFYHDINRLYDPSFCTIKVHYLEHVCDSVRDFGPLGNYSTDMFESVNGKFSRINHAKFQVESHLIEKYLKQYFLPNAFQTMRTAEKEHINDNPQYCAIVQERIDAF
jgi:hypothetical protein